MLTGEELGAAIASAIEKKKVKKKDVADFFGVKPPSIQDWIRRGTIDKAKLPALWQYFSDVVGPEHWGLVTPPNVEPGPDVKGVYPLLSSVQAGMWTELCASFTREDAQDWYPSTKSLGPCGYMLRVKGRSMENPGGSPSFTEGMILHVNPDLDPTPGLYVIVRREGSDEATFKRYIHIEGVPYLEAINPDWPKDQKYLKLMPGDVWCGVVVDASLGGLIRACLEEVFHNIDYHSGVDTGCVFAQHFPKTHRICISISDFGIGIPTRVRTREPDATDASALRLAVKEGWTTKTNVVNRGVGLSTLLKYITQRNSGTVLIHSGNGYLSATRGPEVSSVTSRTLEWAYPGTLVKVVLRTDTLERLENDVAPEVFEW